jgi:U3 small nucleolar RNA-associated protein MPP10
MEEQDAFIPELIQILSSPEKSVLPLLLSGDSLEEARDEGKDAARRQLQITCQFLFREIEGLSKVYHKAIANKKKDGGLAPSTSLAGLEELYLGDVSAPVDAETIWGQVDLQTNALLSMLKKSTKSLSRATEREDATYQIRLLDMADDTNVSEDDDDIPDDEDDNDDGNDDDENDDGNEDEETRRIKDRMERAMEDMEDEDDEKDDDEEEDIEEDESLEGDDPKNRTEDGGEALIDPAAEELNDGFFDIDEMEGFADEEEEYLPEDAFGTVRPEGDEQEETKIPQKSFHQKQREGLINSEEENSDDDDEDDQLIIPSANPVRRKKYRKDDEIEALYNLYDAPANDDDDAIINMTAADFFGKPNKKFLENQKEKKSKKVSDDDADSWDEQGFEDEGVGWRDEESDEHDENDADDRTFDHDDADDGEPTEKYVEKRTEKLKAKGLTKKHVSTDKLQQQIETLEQEMIAEKPWQMTGETKGTSRPVNSLLEANPEFEVASKRAPLITVEHTENLEDIIKRRILAEDWDDVVPRELPDVAWNAKRGELPEVSQEKSKLSLGELYEREYLKKAVGFDVDATEKQTVEEQAKSEMRALFANLCSKLDALSNYHFAPRPVAEEADVKPVSTPAIAMEEVLPLHVSEASAVAPEEVFGGKRGRDSELKGESEKDQVRLRLQMNLKMFESAYNVCCLHVG